MAAAQEPAVTQLSVLERPIVGNPVVLQDVTNAISFRSALRKRRKIIPEAVSDNAVSEAIINEHKIIQRFAGEGIAPPWFAGAVAAAMATAMATALQPVLERLDAMVLANARALNGSARIPTDTIAAPIIPPAVAPPPGFPATISALLTLSNNRCEECMAAYGLVLPLDAENVVAEKRRLLANYLGVRAGTLE